MGLQCALQCGGLGWRADEMILLFRVDVVDPHPDAAVIMKVIRDDLIRPADVASVAHEGLVDDARVDDHHPVIPNEDLQGRRIERYMSIYGNKSFPMRTSTPQ